MIARKMLGAMSIGILAVVLTAFGTPTSSVALADGVETSSVTCVRADFGTPSVVIGGTTVVLSWSSDREVSWNVSPSSAADQTEVVVYTDLGEESRSGVFPGMYIGDRPIWLAVCVYSEMETSGYVTEVPLHEAHIGTVSECAAQWHFVVNQLEANAPPGVLTATFQNEGVVQASPSAVHTSVQSYDIVLNGPDTLLGAVAAQPGDHPDAKLVLSHVSCTTTTTTDQTTTSTTTADTTTTTTDQTTTSTTTADTTTTTGGGQTTTTQTTTTSSPPASTTSTTIGNVSGDTLPYTGPWDPIGSVNGLIPAGLGLIALGQSFLLAARRGRKDSA